MSASAPRGLRPGLPPPSACRANCTSRVARPIEHHVLRLPAPAAPRALDWHSCRCSRSFVPPLRLLLPSALLFEASVVAAPVGLIVCGCLCALQFKFYRFFAAFLYDREVESFGLKIYGSRANACFFSRSIAWNTRIDTFGPCVNPSAQIQDPFKP